MLETMGINSIMANNDSKYSDFYCHALRILEPFIYLLFFKMRTQCWGKSLSNVTLIKEVSIIYRAYDDPT